MSACVKWAKEEVEAFNKILSRQLSSTEQGGPVWTQCMERAKEHASKLSDVGLDFMNLVGKEMRPTPKSSSGDLASAAAPVGLGLA